MKRAMDRLRFRRDHRWVPTRASEYFDGELRPRERSRVERHLDKCPECRALLRGLQAILGALETMRSQDEELVADAVLASVQSRIAELPGDGA